MAERVLIVEDDAPVRRMLVRSLGAEGFEVRSAADGGAALAMAEEAAPDLVVLDVTMPGLTGIDVCRRLRDKGLTGGVLMLTARDAIEDRVRGLDAGADDYVVKPFAIDEVVARLHALTRRGRDRSDRLSFAGLTLDTTTSMVERAGGDAIERIWSGAAVDNIVDRYVGRLRRKLGDPPVIRTVRGVGFILDA